MSVILANTFSPKMVQTAGKFWVEPTTLGKIREFLDNRDNIISIISHEITAEMLQHLGVPEATYCRKNYTYKLGDVICCFIPNFKGVEWDEIEEQGFKYYFVCNNQKELNGY